ncbi:hypothetical protein [Planomonospora sp. ID82291]|uniref:hypothetical protein n=1 Tax=Planomonospora sp. ID82291 TaxID=2738136 RepID=UPI0027DD908C|nr:hypothetical protein [Planomonospora sp. ID82291]
MKTFTRDVNHRDWLSLVEVSGPFLSLPVLRSTWKALDGLDKQERERLRLAHAAWQKGGGYRPGDRRAWIEYCLRTLLRWGDAVHFGGLDGGLDALRVDVPEHETTLVPSFALAVPGEAAAPATARLIGMISSGRPTARMKTSTWAATPADRVAHLCRHHGVELGLVTDGRWWTLVWAPRGKTTTTATFDAVSWPEAAERDVVRAFVSLLNRDRFFSVPEAVRLPALLAASLDSQEDITEALGVQVRQAVELLVAAFGRAGVPGEVSAHDVYRGAVSVMMRIVFLLFAEERKLLPSDNAVYAAAYSAGRLCAELEQRALEGSEEELAHSHAAWNRLLALFRAVHRGVEHPRLTMHAHDGSLFDPDAHSWMPLTIDDRTVLHMLRAVQYVTVGTGKNRERRTLSFRSLDVEQIGSTRACSPTRASAPPTPWWDWSARPARRRRSSSPRWRGSPGPGATSPLRSPRSTRTPVSARSPRCASDSPRWTRPPRWRRPAACSPSPAATPTWPDVCCRSSE